MGWMEAQNIRLGQRWLKRGLAVCLGWAIALGLALGEAMPLFGQPSAQTDSDLPTELRGVWLTNIDSEVLFSEDNVSEAIARLKRLHFNTLYPTVWNWGYSLYPSSIAEQETGQAVYPHPGLSDRDMLAEMVEQGHQNGFSVIPWFEFGMMLPADSVIAQRHPDWITQRRDGSQIVMEGSDPRVWLNPAHPEVQQFILNLITELASTYDIDGIQFDDHMGMPIELGYDDYTVNLYRRSHQGNDPPADANHPEWKAWRAAFLTDLIAEIFQAVKAVSPDCLLALSPNPREFAYDAYLQDWWTWERRGYVEELIIQIYRNDMERFIYELERPEIALVRSHIPLAIGILTGLRNRPVTMEVIAAQVNTVRDYGLAGVSFFFYETLGDRDAEFLRLFPTVAIRPDLRTGWQPSAGDPTYPS